MLTNTQFIRQAALRGGPITAGEKVIEYPDLEYSQVDDSTCWLCGGPTEGLGIPTKKGIKDTFTDHDLAKNMASKSLCQGCAFCLGRQSLRNYSLLATTDRLYHPGRSELRDILLNPPEPPFLFAIAVSGQRHLSFKTPINYNNHKFSVRFEDIDIEVIPEELAECLDIVEQLYVYFTKAEISNWDYKAHRIKECGVAKWQSLVSRLEKWKGTRTLMLAVFVAHKREEKDYVDSKPTVSRSDVRPIIGGCLPKQAQLSIW